MSKKEESLHRLNNRYVSLVWQVGSKGRVSVEVQVCKGQSAKMSPCHRRKRSSVIESEEGFVTPMVEGETGN